MKREINWGAIINLVFDILIILGLVCCFIIIFIQQGREIASLKETIANDNTWLEIMQYEVEYWYDIAHGVVR